MADNGKIGANIKKYRKEKKITQKQLAELIGKTESSIQKYEAGKVEIPTSVLNNIAEKLNCTPIQLYGITTDIFLSRLREQNSDPFLIFLDSIGYKIFIDEKGKLFITISEKPVPLMREKYKILKEQIISYCKFATEDILNKPS